MNIYERIYSVMAISPYYLSHMHAVTLPVQIIQNTVLHYIYNVQSKIVYFWSL